MRETAEQVRDRLIKAEQGRVASRMQNGNSIGACDSAQRDYRFAVKRIRALTDEELLQRALDL